MKNNRIPEKDLKLINDAFAQTGPVETLGKNSSGKIVAASRKVVNDKSIVIQDFSGRVLRGQKSLVTGKNQVVIGVKGQKFDDIPLETRKLVVWLESDFE